MHRKAIKNEKLVCISVYILMLCGVSIPNAGFLSSLHSVFSVLPGVEKVISLANFNLAQTRYSYITIAMIIAVALLGFAFFYGKKRIVLVTRNYNVLLFLLVLILISAVMHYEWLSALKCILYILLFLNVLTLTNEKRTALRLHLEKAVIVTAIINSCVILLQFVSLYSMTGLSWETFRRLRCEGIMLDSIIASLLNAFAIGVIFFNGTKVRSRKNLILIALWALTGVLTGARTFYLALAAIIIVKYFRYQNKTRRLLIAIIFICVLLVVLFVATGYTQTYSSTLTGEIDSSSRAIKRNYAIELFEESPILGIGTNQYRTYEKNIMSLRGINGTNPHNIYLQVLCENGIVCFVLLLYAIYRVLHITIRRKDNMAICFLFIYLVVGWTLGITGSVRISTLVFALVATAVTRREDANHA